MKHHRRLLSLLVALASLGSSAGAALPPSPLPGVFDIPEFVTGWVAKSEDNICGLRDARMLSSPAKVDFQQLLDLTPEMKKIVEDGIDRGSPEGIQLNQKAIDRVKKACKAVMTEKGHCSVWKKVEHSDGRTVADITEDVKVKL